MPVQILEMSAVSVLNHCAKHLAREQGASAEAWRFPIVETHAATAGQGAPPEPAPPGSALNAVTFVHDGRRSNVTDVGVIGTFDTLYEAIPLSPVRFNDELTGYRAVTVAVPQGEVHLYRFVVDGAAILDPINPQRVQVDDGNFWSRFFTDNCRQPLVLQAWQIGLLERLVAHILPFRSRAGQSFLDQYYYTQDRRGRDENVAHAYRLDDRIGIVNYIDNLLAREEAHRLGDYQTGLAIIDAVLRQRNPFVEPTVMPRDMYVDLYDEMARDDVPGWDYGRYGSPRFFLQLLRRHAFTGAFSHPRYGGNGGAAGWAFLAERYTDADGKTLFDWRQAIEAPLGTSTTYRG